MLELDPVGTALRWRGTVCPRKYNVLCPNALWHIDGNHKMIRWRFVIHTAIDGYSSLTPYLYCAKNNNSHSLTVSKCISAKLMEYPQELEVIMVSRMWVQPARCWSAVEYRGSMIAGSSVHNQRAERLHRDVISGVLKSYTDEFHMMEASGLLDPLKKIHLLSLHLVLLQQINKSLQELTNQWNYHCLSTEGGSSPLQLDYLHSLIPTYLNRNESVTHYVELVSVVCEMLPNS